MTARAAIAGHQATIAVALLGLLCVAAFIDAMILALLMVPLKASLGISEVQFGLLFGLGFAVCYVAVSIPLATIADRGNRKVLLLCGVVLWCLMTLASAFAWSFVSLLVTRAGVAVGEAVLMPVAVSMIADLYPPDRRTMPTTIISTIRAITSQGALAVGGGAMALAQVLSAHTGLPPWRLTFIIVAIPGLIVALPFALLVREPSRRDDGGQQSAALSLVATVRHLLDHAGLYLGMFLGVGFMLTVTIIMIAWMPTMLIREHGITPAQAGLAYGLPALAGALAGTMSVPLLLKRLDARPRVAALMIAMALALVLVPASPLLIGSTNLVLVMIGIALATSGVASSTVLPPLLVQAITPPRFRARLVAMYLSTITLLSQGAGPSLVTSFGTHFPGTPLSVNIVHAVWLMFALAAVFVTVAMVSYYRGSVRAIPQEV